MPQQKDLQQTIKELIKNQGLTNPTEIAGKCLSNHGFDKSAEEVASEAEDIIEKLDSMGLLPEESTSDTPQDSEVSTPPTETADGDSSTSEEPETRQSSPESGDESGSNDSSSSTDSEEASGTEQQESEPADTSTEAQEESEPEGSVETDGAGPSPAHEEEQPTLPNFTTSYRNAVVCTDCKEMWFTSEYPKVNEPCPECQEDVEALEDDESGPLAEVAACESCGDFWEQDLPWFSIDCPICGADAGNNCVRPDGTTTGIHEERMIQAERSGAVEECTEGEPTNHSSSEATDTPPSENVDGEHEPSADEPSESEEPERAESGDDSEATTSEPDTTEDDANSIDTDTSPFDSEEPAESEDSATSSGDGESNPESSAGDDDESVTEDTSQEESDSNPADGDESGAETEDGPDSAESTSESADAGEDIDTPDADQGNSGTDDSNESDDAGTAEPTDSGQTGLGEFV